MNLDAQNLIALAAVSVAAAYLARVVWQSFAKRQAAGCGSCASCPTAATQEPSVVSIGPLVSNERQTSDGSG